MVELKRVARVVKGGKRFRFRATVVIGNRTGKVGAGLGKGVDVATAMEKAVAKAKRTMITVPMENGTIPHDSTAKLGGSVVLLKPAPKGTGVIAGGAVRAVVELAGVKDILSKMLGASNQTNNVMATMKALSNLRSSDMILMHRNKPKRKKREASHVA